MTGCWLRLTWTQTPGGVGADGESTSPDAAEYVQD